MALLLDSEAQFDLRIAECKVPDTLRDALKGNGIDTLATLSYSFGQPEQAIDHDAFAQWVRTLDPRATMGAVASLRRLTFESQTQLLAILKEQVTAPDTAVKRIPQAEREARMTLVHELTSLKTPDRILDIEANKIVVKDKEDKLEVPAHTSLQVLEALKRRGIALDFGDCVGFIERERYVQTLFEHLHREPPQGYQRCTIAQCRQGSLEEGH
ncbi:Uncharacterized protein SCF082_LOCUS18247 [Durusdinium trenchii]|uniref:Uncharacterized protein n=1 Tax=Durusdinium trenchii TaxID=1381693 RepID=A0ABP0KNN8_9DINO